jgi:hypothetical protein
MIRRREFIAGLSGAAAWPLVARAQQPGIPVIGFINFTEEAPSIAFRQGLSEAGYAEGRNVLIEFLWSEDEGKLATIAAELVRRRLSMIVSVSAVATAQAIKASAGTVPIVFAIGPDPVTLGFVASLKGLPLARQAENPINWWRRMKGRKGHSFAGQHGVRLAKLRLARPTGASWRHRCSVALLRCIV